LESNASEMSELEQLVAIEEIKRLKARRDRAVDTKDWKLYESLHAADAWSEAAGQRKPGRHHHRASLAYAGDHL
jgi:hypothetical protein